MMSEWINLLIAALSRLLATLFVSTDESDENCFKINFKCSNGENITISIDKSCTVRRAKEIIVTRASIGSVDCIKILFAGHELSDELVIGDCDLVNGSILHIIQVQCSSNQTKPSPINNQLTSAWNKRLVSSDDNDEDDENSVKPPVASCLTVYCPSCQSIQPGRMRVRCATCKETAVILSRDPRSWSDVLTPNAITGKCHNSSTRCHEEASVDVEFFFKCSAKSCNDKLCVPLNQVKYNSRNITCLSCGEVTEKIFRFECLPKVQHSLCLNCFSMYARSKLNDRQFRFIQAIGYTLECPMRCENSFIREMNHFHLLGEDSFAKYQRFSFEISCLAAGALYCPNSKCSELIMMKEKTSECTTVVCTNCLTVFASQCKGDPHVGECSLDPSGKFVATHQFSQHDYDELASYSEIVKISKPCPGCKTPTERDSGCMHMTCTIADCHFEWCWLCESRWSRDCMAWHWFDE